MTAIRVSLLEQFIILRSSHDTSDGEHYRPNASTDELATYEHLEASLNQIRGLVILDYDKLPVDSSEVQISFKGVSVWVEWNDIKGEKVPTNRSRDIISYTVTLSIKGKAKGEKGGIESIPFSIPVPSSLPPTTDSDTGADRYAVTATVGGPTSPKSYTAESPIRLYSSGDRISSELPLQENERVEGLCLDDRVQFVWTADMQVPIAGLLSMDLSLVPITPSQDELSIGSLHILLEESTVSSISTSMKQPIVRRWSLAKMHPSPPDNLLPWSGKTSCSHIEAALLSAGLLYNEHKQSYSNKVKPSINLARAEQDVRDNLASVIGPWNLSWNVRAPSCTHTPINPTVRHPKSIVTVSHRLVAQICFTSRNKPDAAIELTRPIRITSLILAEPGSILPCYYCATFKDHPYSPLETWRQAASKEELLSQSSSSALPAWLSRLTRSNRQNLSPKTDIQDDGRPANGVSKLWLDLSSQSVALSASIL